MRGKNILKTKK